MFGFGGKREVKEGVVICPIPYRCWNTYMELYSDIVIPKGHKVKVHFKNGVPIKINTMTKEVYLNGTIYLSPTQYGNCIKLL